MIQRSYRPRVCEGCSSTYSPRTANQKFCSFDCSLWSRIDKRGDDECWPWLGPTTKGRGMIKIWGTCRTEQVPRVVYRIKKGPLEIGQQACHACDNPSCCNPNHLFAGTQVDNMRDAVSKGRKQYGGTGSPNASFSVDVLRIVRGMPFVIPGMQKSVSELLGVRRQTVYEARYGRTYV